MNLILDYLIDLGVDGSEILKSYKPGDTDWLLPPVILDPMFFGPDFNYMQIEVSKRGLDMQKIFAEYRKETVKLAKQTPQSLTAYVGSLVMWLVANSSYKSFTSNSTDLYLKYRTVPPIGIKDGKVLGSPVYLEVSKAELHRALSEPRDVITSTNFDIFDRMKMWMIENWKLLPDYEHIEYALTLLKLSGTRTTAIVFEQALHAPDVTVAKSENIFTDEALDEIRDLWATTEFVQLKFPKLYDRLIDKFLDSKQWKEIFGSFPVAKSDEMPTRKINQAISGMDRFITFYLNKQRAIKESELC